MSKEISKPLTAIHKCDNGKYRIGNGECKFDSYQVAVNAFEHWIQEKTQWPQMGRPPGNCHIPDSLSTQ